MKTGSYGAGRNDPIQAKGKAVDKRSDVWAFGCVLYEMLSGQRAFAGGDVSLALEGAFETGGSQATESGGS